MKLNRTMSENQLFSGTSMEEIIKKFRDSSISSIESYLLLIKREAAQQILHIKYNLQ